MDNSKTKQIILGKVTDIFFDLCIIFIFLISVGAVLIGGAITTGAMAYIGSEVGENFSKGLYEWTQSHIRKIN